MGSRAETNIRLPQRAAYFLHRLFDTRHHPRCVQPQQTCANLRNAGAFYREYLELFHHISLPTYTLRQIVSSEIILPPAFLLLEFFKDYLQRGYYPFRDNIYESYLMQTVNATIYVDILQYADLSIATARKLKRLLAIIAMSAPVKPNFTQIGSQLGVFRNNVADLCWIERAGLIGQLRDGTGKGTHMHKLHSVLCDFSKKIH